LDNDTNSAWFWSGIGFILKFKMKLTNIFVLLDTIFSIPAAFGRKIWRQVGFLLYYWRKHRAVDFGAWWRRRGIVDNSLHERILTVLSFCQTGMHTFFAWREKWYKKSKILKKNWTFWKKNQNCEKMENFEKLENFEKNRKFLKKTKILKKKRKFWKKIENFKKTRKFWKNSKIFEKLEDFEQKKWKIWKKNRRKIRKNTITIVN